MATRKILPQKEALFIRSHSLTFSTEAVLKRIRQDATDVIGRTVSTSAVERALLCYAEQQGMAWVRECLYPLIEQEMESGIRWGKTKS